ncbi:hypothetical protein PN462_09665 [Spirulina sp. CS-785/01]|uniref:hypothetical protein n=1 Tax=Spirulina sp. CS-785/01 TaxID=3021716 RepID=UPI00232DBB65|nr:hypothetical protein [Spirulina sp. CS-785/01]MDB9313365.1 hypothetical protein [Spirulina sp. CS-785/01]
MVCEIGELSVPPKGTLDPEILLWCEEYDFVLVTNNRTSMPVHLAEHLDRDRHVPGIFIWNPKLTVGQNIDELILLAFVSFRNEYRDHIVHLPQSYSLSEFV